MRLISDKKIEKFRREMEKKEIEVAIFLNMESTFESNIEYFTGFRQERLHSFSCLLIDSDKMSLVTSSLEHKRAQKEVKGIEVLNKKDYSNSLIKVLKKELRGKKRIGVNENLFPYRLYKKFSSRKYVDISGLAYSLRSIKEAKEIEVIKKACRLTNHVAEELKGNLSQKITERELSLIIKKELMKKGAEDFSFPPIIKSGENSSYIHPHPGTSNRKLKRGLGLIDFGVIYKGYCTDVTLPLEIGKLNPKETLIKKTVLEAYEESVHSLKVGVPTWKVFDAAKNIIESNGFEFKHALGHGIGMDVHEFPNLGPRPEDKKILKKWKEEKLKENMVFTIEPGVYVSGIGGYRIENDILLTKKGPEILTKSKPIRI